MADELYTGADRGEFLAFRMMTADGLVKDANCRIKQCSVFNYLSDFVYCIVGYQIEYWEKDAPAPYNGGESKIYRPADRPDFTTQYMRTKVRNTAKMLYLEDAIINDFISVKLLQGASALQSYDQAAAKQIESIAKTRMRDGSDVQYRNAIHTTRYANTADAPLALTEQWMQYMANQFNSPPDDTLRYIRDMPFLSLKDMADKLIADFNANK